MGSEAISSGYSLLGGGSMFELATIPCIVLGEEQHLPATSWQASTSSPLSI